MKGVILDGSNIIKEIFLYLLVLSLMVFYAYF